MQTLKYLVHAFHCNWERVVFSFFGFAFLGVCFYYVYLGRVADAAVLFGIGFLCFVYANISRFKRFKGLGFEAELWEDKQKEAADLIQRLREVLSIYTRELVLGRVTRMRAGGHDWRESWKLYDDLIDRHSALGQSIDFSDLKNEIDDYFLIDMTYPAVDSIRLACSEAKNKAMEKIRLEFGSPIRDGQGYSKRVEQWRSIPEEVKDCAQVVFAREDLAERALSVWHEAKVRLEADFGVEAHIDEAIIFRLEQLSKVFRSRPIKVTDELIRWANSTD